jgi:hypothetical protein
VALERRVVRLNQALIEAAHVATHFGAWQSMVFDHLGPIGFDVAFIKALPPHQAVASRGFDSGVLAMTTTHPACRRTRPASGRTTIAGNPSFPSDA